MKPFLTTVPKSMMDHPDLEIGWGWTPRTSAEAVAVERDCSIKSTAHHAFSEAGQHHRSYCHLVTHPVACLPPQMEDKTSPVATASP